MSIGIISTEHQLFTNTKLDVTWFKSNSIEDMNIFCHQHDVIIFDGITHYAWHQSNLPKPHKTDDTLTPNKFIAKFNGKELYMPLERVDWTKFDLILFPDNTIRQAFLRRVLDQRLDVNQAKIMVCEYPYKEISPGNKVGIYGINENSDLHWLLKIVNDMNVDVYAFGDDMKYKSCEDYFYSILEVQITFGHKTNLLDWLSDMATVIFPNYGRGDLLMIDLCMKSNIKVIAHYGHVSLDNTNLKKFDDVIKSLI